MSPSRLAPGPSQCQLRFAETKERDQIWTRQKQAISTFVDYEAATDRVIPVVVLDRK
jgi:hypothetical protein